MAKFSRVSRIYLCDPFCWQDEHLEAKDRYDALVSELDGFVIPPAICGLVSPPLKVRIREQNYSDALHLGRHGKMPVRFYESLTPIVIEADWPLDDRVSRDVGRAGILTLFEHQAVRLMVAISLYLPGSARSHYSYTAKEHRQTLNFACGNELQECIPFLVRNDIPVTPNVSFREFLEWLSGISGFWSGRPASNLERSVCLMTHMHHFHFLPDNIDDFVWCVAAIEAVYTTNTTAIVDQIKRRIGLLLPDYTHAFNKKALNALYSYRSRLIHGDISVPSRFITLSDEEVEKDDYGDSFATAVAIAVETVHRACELGLRKVTFAEVMET